MGTTMGKLQKKESTVTKRFFLERLFSHSSLLVWLLLIALLPLLIATFFTYQAAKETLLYQVEERLSYIVQEEIYQIENYIEERKSDINELALIPEVYGLAIQFKAAANPNLLQLKAKKNLGFYLNITSEKYKDVYLISPLGEVWYSANNPALVGKNIKQFLNNYAQLAGIFDKANTLMSIQISNIEMSENKLTSHFYLATPMFDRGRIIAILILSLPSDQVKKMLSKTASLGQSGEIIIAQPAKQGSIISSRNKIYIDKMADLINSPFGKVIKEAGKGTSGFGKLLDENNTETIAAWRYLPPLGWGIMAKINLSEAFSPIINLRHQLYLLVALTLGLVILIAQLVADNIRRAEERTEQLLLNILPARLVERLEHGERTIADNYEATVLFVDIVGFTEFSNKMFPETVVEFLNGIFSLFDTIIDNTAAEKIKTIGDAYMLACGLPDPNPDHAKIVADIALSMKQKIAEYNLQNNTHYQIRIGIASGAVTAGIIGFKKFSYDVWGGTVNLASRMESQGMAGQIQVAESTYLLLKDEYDFDKRGDIVIKGIGSMTTYLLLHAKGIS